MRKVVKIKKIKAKEILDSRGNPTVQVDLVTDLGLFKASVPSGASKGKYEAVELRNGGKRYHGLGVLKAVHNINKIIGSKLKGKEVIKQKEIDEFLIKLDGTKNKSNLGANSILGVSMAVCRAGAFAKNLPLYKYISEIYRDQAPLNFTQACPQPALNIINGGVHAKNELDFQEFMIVPQTIYFFKALQIAIEVYQELRKIIKSKYRNLAIPLGDEGGFAPPLKNPEEAIELILDAAKNLGYQKKIKIIIDIAASQFYERGFYKTRIGNFTSEDLLNYYLDLIEKYPILGLEDPFAENDWLAWKKLNSQLQTTTHLQMDWAPPFFKKEIVFNSQFLIIGDDLLATNPKRMKLAKEREACNAVIIKPNQIGTVSEAIAAAKLAQSYGWKVIVSHRSGETRDDFIADFAVGIGANLIKAGSPFPPERMAKYKRLLKIEDEIRR